VKKVVISEGKTLVIEMLGDAIKIIIKGGIGYEPESNDENGLKEIWEKVKAAVQEQTGHYKKEIDALVEKYKPRIIDQLQKVKKVVISEGKTLVIEMLGDAIKIIIKGGIGYEPESNLSIGDLWDSVKAAVGHLKGEVKVAAQKVIDEFKPQIIDGLQHLKKVVVKGAKTLVIEVRDAIVKVISGGQVATSDGSYLISNCDVYGVIDGSSEPNHLHSIAEIWSKVKKAASRVPDVMRAATDKIVEKYRQKIIDALMKVGNIVVEAGQKIAIKIVEDVVHIFVDGKEVATSG